MTSSEIAIQLLAQSITTLSLFIFFSKTFDSLGELREVVAYFIFFSGSIFLYFENLDTGITLLIAFSLILLLSLAYDISYLWRLMTALFLFLMIMIVGSFSPIVTSYSSTTENILISENTSILVSRLLILGSVLLLTKLRKAYGHGYLSIPYIATMIICPLISVISILFLMEATILRGYPYVWTFVFGFLFVVNLLVFLLCDHFLLLKKEQKRLADFEKQQAYYLSQYSIMEEIQSENLQLEHDLKHVIQGHFNTEAAQDQISEWIATDKKTTTLSGNMVIDSILNYKRHTAEKFDIDMRFNLEIPVDLHFDITTISIILGNLLDNAIDACRVNDQKEQKKIDIHINYHQHNLYIKIQNPYNHPLKMLGPSKFLTTKKDKKRHGVGIENIRKIIEEKNSVLAISNEKNIFTVEVVLNDI